MGTEIRTFSTLKEMNDYLIDQINQYRALYEDYSQWLGSLLRGCEENCKNEEWYQKSASLQKNLRGASKKMPETRNGKKGGGSGKNSEPSCWVSSGEILLCTTEQGQAEILFEAIEEIGSKIQGLEKFKSGTQQLERIGFGKNVNYITLIKDDVPCKIVIRSMSNVQGSEAFSFITDISVSTLFNDSSSDLD
jgi:hypothetical protein